MAPAGQGCRIGFAEQVGCGHVYASENAAASLGALMNVRLENRLNRARSRRFGLIGVSWFFVSVRSPSPHVALTIPLADQAAACD